MDPTTVAMLVAALTLAPQGSAACPATPVVDLLPGVIAPVTGDEGPGDSEGTS